MDVYACASIYYLHLPISTSINTTTGANTIINTE